MFWGASEKRFAIVKAIKDESADSDSDCKIVAKGANLAHGSVCRKTDVGDVEGHVSRENEAEISRRG